MRLSSLDLLAFGHFTNKTLAFTDKGGAIDIVFGNNEAGKSTSRRGVSNFLFGIPVRTTDDFIHPKPTLRLGATVVDSTGKSTRLVRRKGAKDTLRDGADNVVAEDVLARLLGGLDQELFDQMFSLSRVELVSGGNDLLAGKGSLGEALFGASMGLAGINDLLQTLEKEAAELFKPGGSKPLLNATLRELDERRHKVRELELRPADFIAHETALADALAERSRLDTELHRAEADLRRLERNKRLLPLAVLRSEITTDIAELGDVVALPESARQDRLDAQRERERAESEIARLQERIDSLEVQLTVVQPNEALLARADEIRDLHSEIGAHRKAETDLPELKSRRRGAMKRAETLLAQSHPGRKLEDAHNLRLAITDRTAIFSLSDQFGRFEEVSHAAASRRNQIQAKLKGAEKALRELPIPVESLSASAALAAARRRGDIEAAIASDEATQHAAAAQLRADLEALPAFAGSLDELERLPVPLPATVARFVDAYDELDMRHRDLAVQESRLVNELADHRERLEALDSTGAVLSEDDLVEARVRRQQGWLFVRQTLEGEIVDISAFTTDRALPDAFEHSMSAVDDIADRLRREADQVAKHAEMQASHTHCAGQLAGVQSQFAEVVDTRSLIAVEWSALWQPSSISPLPPAEMQAWLTAREALVSEAANQREQRVAIDAKLALVKQHIGALRRELTQLGGGADEDASLAELVTLVDTRIEAERSRGEAVARARELVRGLTAELEDAECTARDAEGELSQWTMRWSAAVVRLSLGSHLTPEQARSIVEALNEVFAALDEAASFESRIASIARDVRKFTDNATTLATSVAADIDDLGTTALVEALERLLRLATAEAAQVEELEKQLEALTGEQREAQERHEDVEAELTRLIAAAMCSSLTDLEAAEDRSARMLGLRVRLQSVEEQMTLIAAAPAADLAAEVADLKLDQVEAQISEQSAALENVNEERQRLDESVGQERTLLAELRRGEGAAEAAVAVEATKAAAREQAEQYALLKLAIAILRREIERFREESHGPLLKRASYFFSKLTCQAYTALTTGFDERGTVILLGRRSTGVEITVDELSEGTRDQLYLALRLATIEQQIDRSEPLPLIVDDLFVNFDDDRAAAGFELLAELAQKTQVVFFTHHRHLVDLAKATLSPSQWSIQELCAGEAERLIQAA
jgi:uncharacterized protein YhaN